MPLYQATVQYLDPTRATITIESNTEEEVREIINNNFAPYFPEFEITEITLLSAVADPATQVLN
jgi:hypothetical protein